MSGQLPTYALAIANALSNGYHVDAAKGAIYGLKGAPLSVKMNGTQRYPTVPLVVVGMAQRYYVVPAHKVVAYSLWGEAAFAKGIHVRHGKGGVLDITAKNLTLGTAKENEADKCPKVKSAAGRMARAAQDGLSNAKLNAEQVAQLRADHAALKRKYEGKGKLPNGTLQALCAKYGIGKTNVNDIVKGKTWTR